MTSAKIIPLGGDDEFIRASDLEQEQGTSFGWFDRMLFGWDNGQVTDYTDWEARDLHEMLAKDYKSRQLEQVLALPVTSADREITANVGDKGEQAYLQSFWELDQIDGGCREDLHTIVDQMTTAFTYKKAFFEKVWTRPTTGPFAGQAVYSAIAFRPQTTCKLMRDAKTGAITGFEQEPYFLGRDIGTNKNLNDQNRIPFPLKRAVIHVHGERFDPINGTSDLEIAYWCYKTRQKLLFLWFQFLENVSLPRVIVRANDPDSASQIARNVAQMKGSGVLPIGSPGGPESVGITPLDLSGKGSEQFQAAISWLDNAATDATLASGVLNPSGTAANGGMAGGSYALSSNANDFFLQMQEAKVREIERTVRRQIFAPMVFNKFGPGASVPLLKFEPLQDLNQGVAVKMLETLLGSRDAAEVPGGFIEDLAGLVANYVGLDAAKVKADFKANAATMQAMQERMQKLNSAPAGMTAGATVPQVAAVAGAVSKATNMVNAANAQKQQMTKPTLTVPGAPPKPKTPLQAQQAVKAKGMQKANPKQ